jgi:hypothetical protein
MRILQPALSSIQHESRESELPYLCDFSVVTSALFLSRRGLFFFNFGQFEPAGCKVLIAM